MNNEVYSDSYCEIGIPLLQNCTGVSLVMLSSMQNERVEQQSLDEFHKCVPPVGTHLIVHSVDRRH